MIFVFLCQLGALEVDGSVDTLTNTSLFTVVVPRELLHIPSFGLEEKLEKIEKDKNHNHKKSVKEALRAQLKHEKAKNTHLLALKIRTSIQKRTKVGRG